MINFQAYKRSEKAVGPFPLIITYPQIISLWTQKTLETEVMNSWVFLDDLLRESNVTDIVFIETPVNKIYVILTPRRQKGLQNSSEYL